MSSWEKYFMPEIVQAGKAYFEQGKVKKFTETDDGFQMIVRGSRNYHVRFLDDGFGITDFHCDCESGQKGIWCKHIAAGMFKLEEEYGDIFEPDEEDGIIDVDGPFEPDEETDIIDAKGPSMPEKKNASRNASRKSRQQSPRAKSGKSEGREDQFRQALPDLAAMQQKSRMEVLDQAQDPTEESMEEYRYFHYWEFRDGLNISKDLLQQAETLRKSGRMGTLHVQFGEENLIGSDRILGVGSCYLRDSYENCMIVFDRRKVLEARCDHWECGFTRKDAKSYLGKKLCVHQAALLLMIEAYLAEHNTGDVTNNAGIALINQVLQRNGAFQDPEWMRDRQALRIEPQLEIRDKTYASCSFRVGAGRLYKIKKLQDFIDHLNNGEKMKFGKQTELLLERECFSEEDLGWISMIEDHLSEERQLNGVRMRSQRNYYGAPAVKEDHTTDSIPLFGARMDRFFSLLKEPVEAVIEEHYQKEKAQLAPARGELQLTVDLSPMKDEITGEVLGVQLRGEAPPVINGQNYAYYVKNGCLNQISAERMRELEPLLSRAGYGTGEIRINIGRNFLADFYYRIYPTLRKVVRFEEYEADLIRKYLSPEPVFVFYLDYQDAQVVSRADVCYGTRIHSLGDILKWSGQKRELEPYRDTIAEQTAAGSLTSFIKAYDEKLDLFFLPEDNEELFRFLEQGLDVLTDLGTVYMTEQFKKLGVRRTVKVNVGLSIQSDLLDLEIAADDLSEEELLEVLSSYRQKKKFYRLKDGSFLKLEDNNSVADLLSIMEGLNLPVQEFVRGKMEIPVYRALYLDKVLERKEQFYVERDRNFKTLLKAFKTIEDIDAEVPESLKKVLRPYQESGYRWLRTLSDNRFGGILADEMGLGKTLQMISVLLAEKQERERGAKKNVPVTSLVVCPASLVYNWAEEFHRYAPELKVVLAAGTKRERQEVISQCETADVLITSYDLLKRDIDAYHDITFNYEVIDEAQYIKNQKTAAAKTVRAVRSRVRFALTGTPVENRLSELWSIFDYLMPGFLYDYKTFQRTYETKIVREENGEAMERLRRMTAPFLLRRRKQDVLTELPEKIEEVRYARMEQKQRRLYDAQTAMLRNQLRSQSDEEFRQNRFQILAEITRLRQICCDPALYLENYDGGSAKREAFMGLIESALDGEHRVLVFSQFTSMLAMLENDLREAKIPYFLITGETPKEKRMNLVKEFNEGTVPVFLISLKAGGTGLNLTGADTVIHYDPWWNLAVQNQATDRAHRIGQKRVVTEYRLIAQNTIEEKIIDLQEKKRKLAEDLLGGDSAADTTFDRDELLTLLEE